MPYLQSMIQTVQWRIWTAISWLTFLPNLLWYHSSASQVFTDLSRQLLCEVYRAAWGEGVSEKDLGNGNGKSKHLQVTVVKKEKWEYRLVTVLWQKDS